MVQFERLKVNSPNIVHETIDGEAILLDLRSGNYFSLDGVGAVIWEFTDKTGNWGEVINVMVAANESRKETISDSIKSFIEDLVKEDLLVKADAITTTIGVPELVKKLKVAAGDFKPPVVNKYSDMQDLLLLDPIHDVDGKGWPESKDIQPND